MSYKAKEYDKKIFKYQSKNIKNYRINKESYLKKTKPFSKWDSRPLNDSLVWINNELEPSSTVPNLFWGSFAKDYGLSINDAIVLPKSFSYNAYINCSKFINLFKQNKDLFKALTKLLEKSPKKIFMNQDGLKRVDELYFENGNYWKYLIAKDSPFPMSDNMIKVTSQKFTFEENNILNKLKELNIYSIFNNKNTIFFLIDGLLDNSYGFVYQKEPNHIKSSHLFRIKYKKEIEAKYYFYISY